MPRARAKGKKWSGLEPPAFFEYVPRVYRGPLEIIVHDSRSRRQRAARNIPRFPSSRTIAKNLLNPVLNLFLINAAIARSSADQRNIL